MSRRRSELSAPRRLEHGETTFNPRRQLSDTSFNRSVAAARRMPAAPIEILIGESHEPLRMKIGGAGEWCRNNTFGDLREAVTTLEDILGSRGAYSRANPAKLQARSPHRAAGEPFRQSLGRNAAGRSINGEHDKIHGSNGDAPVGRSCAWAVTATPSRPFD